MRTDMQRLSGCLRTVATASLLLLASPAAAEVGAIFDPGQGSSAQGPYELITIIEDADPVGIHWRPYSSSAPNRVLLNSTGETNGDAHLKSILFHHEVIIPITKGQLDFGPWQQLFYGEFDGQRKKRIVVKVMGE